MMFRAFNYWSKKQMEVYANEMTQEVIIREFPYGLFPIQNIPACLKSIWTPSMNRLLM